MTNTSTPQPSGANTAGGGFRLNRLNMILAAILVLQAAAATYLLWPSTTTAASQPLFGDIAMEDVTELSVTDRNDRTVTIERSDDGWVMAGTDGYPARTQQVTTTLQSLLDMNANRVVATTPSSHNRLEVTEDNYQRRIELTAGDTTRTLFMGSSAGAGATHIRLADEDATYLQGQLATYEVDGRPSNWIDVTYFQTAQEAITEFTVENEHGTLHFIREGDTWALEGLELEDDQEFLPNNVTTLVSRLSRININRPLGTEEQPEYGMENPSATIQVHIEPEEGEPADHTFTIGAHESEENVYYFKGSNSPFYVLVAGTIGDEFVQEQRSNFIRTVTPEPEGEGPSQAPTGEAESSDEAEATQGPAPADEAEAAGDAEATAEPEPTDEAESSDEAETTAEPEPTDEGQDNGE